MQDTSEHPQSTLPPQTLLLRFEGRLDAGTVPGLWSEARARLDGHGAGPVRIDAGAVEYCDGAGIAMLYDLMGRGRAGARPVELDGLPPRFRALLDHAATHPTAPPAPRSRPQPLPEQLGRAAVALWGDAQTMITFLGEATAALGWAIVRPRSVRWRDTWAIVEKTGVNALPIVTLIASLLGIILAFQSVVPMRQYGAELYVADLLGLAVLRELGPLITAILLAGRTGAAYAAELGTMKVNEEISALTTMGLDPVRFLVTPRVIACVLMTPLLAVYADLIALIGGAVTMLTFNIPLRTFYAEAVNIVSMTDFVGGLVKAFFFGLLISGVGCLRGLQTGTGASAVGDSATRAVVSSLVLIVAVDGVFALIYWVLDI